MGNLFTNAFNAFGAAAPDPATSVVVVIGFGLVFVVLLVLILALTIFGKIFTFIDSKKNGTPKAPKEKKTNGTAEAATQPVVEKGITADIIAAISAAIACMTGGKYELRGVTRAKNKNAWNAAAANAYTEPF
ncbi:MAG: OadG family transporter subunit [Oscillospiraceae bacterium]